MRSGDDNGVVADIDVVSNQQTSPTIQMTSAVNVTMLPNADTMGSLNLGSHEYPRAFAYLYAGEAIKGLSQSPTRNVPDDAVEQNFLKVTEYG